MWTKIKTLSLKCVQPFKQSTVFFPVLLATATGVLLETTTGLSPVAIGVISGVSLGGFYLSAKATQYVIALANDIRATVQHINTLLETANTRANEIQPVLDNINKTSSEIQKLADILNKDVIVNVNHTTHETQTLIKKLHEDTIPALISELKDVSNTTQNAVDDIAGAAETFSRGGLQINLASTALSQPSETPVARRRRRNEQTDVVPPVEKEENLKKNTLN